MGAFSNILDAVQKDAQTTLDAKVLTRPTLSVTDGTALTYACDVDIGVVTPQGTDQSLNLFQTSINGSILHDVPIARGNQELIYAEVGAPVIIQRSASGRYEITGFSKTMPGTNTRVPVNLATFTFGQVEDLSILSKALTLEQMGSFGPTGWGSLPLGAIAIYQGGTLLRITA